MGRFPRFVSTFEIPFGIMCPTFLEKTENHETIIKQIESQRFYPSKPSISLPIVDQNVMFVLPPPETLPDLIFSDILRILCPK